MPRLRTSRCFQRTLSTLLILSAIGLFCLMMASAALIDVEKTAPNSSWLRAMWGLAPVAMVLAWSLPREWIVDCPTVLQRLLGLAVTAIAAAGIAVSVSVLA